MASYVKAFPHRRLQPTLRVVRDSNRVHRSFERAPLHNHVSTSSSELGLQLPRPNDPAPHSGHPTKREWEVARYARVFMLSPPDATTLELQPVLLFLAFLH